MNKRYTLTLEQWLKNPGADTYTPILDHSPSIGIHDTRAIEHVRTYLWDLVDLSRVSRPSRRDLVVT